MKYSVIVPIYNTHQEFSLMLETFKDIANRRSDFELIIIDDGSDEKFHDFYKATPFVKYIYKENGGVSSARNVGIRESVGDFLLFLDSDDEYNAYIFETLDEVVVSAKTSILFSYEKIYESGKEKKYYLSRNILTGDDILKSYFTKTIPAHVSSLLYSSVIIKSEGILFDETVHHCEDLKFIIEYLSKIDMLNTIPSCLYKYKFRAGSAVNSKFTYKNSTTFDVFNVLYNRFENTSLEPSFNFFYATIYILYFKNLLKNKTCDENVIDIMNSNRLILNRKMHYSIDLFSTTIFLLRNVMKFVPTQLVKFIANDKGK